MTFLTVGLQNKNLLWCWKVKCTVQNQGPECEFLTPMYKTGHGSVPLTFVLKGSVRDLGSKNKAENEEDNRH